MFSWNLPHRKVYLLQSQEKLRGLHRAGLRAQVGPNPQAVCLDEGPLFCAASLTDRVGKVRKAEVQIPAHGHTAWI